MLIKNKNRIDNKKKKENRGNFNKRSVRDVLGKTGSHNTRLSLCVTLLNKPVKIDEKISRATKTLERADQCSYDRLSKLCGQAVLTKFTSNPGINKLRDNFCQNH